MKYILPCILLIGAFVGHGQGLQSPEKFLGYKLGDRFTHHYKVVDYFRHAAETNSNIMLHTYGETYEHRPLIAAIISSQQNIDRWEEIRENNLKRAGLADGDATDEPVAIVWLSYNIHGNEASSMEAAMKTIYELATDAKKHKWLENTVVIIDPAVNPDGRDRYTNFYNQYGSQQFNPNGNALEHHEPWPGGRANHYLFDLNRDWAWQTQIESVKRMELYHSIFPHIHVDFHEQGVNSPYYFAPAAEPFHEVITPWQREFQTAIGKNHARYFDKEGWLYFTRELFDLLYPSYGDTYPTYNGAIGMTYEQAGHGYAGLGIITEYGDTLTLKDRIMHHYTTGISTVEIASQNAKKLTEEFERYFKSATDNAPGKYKTYVIKGSNNRDKLNALLAFLDKHHVQYGAGNAKKSLIAYSYQNNSSGNVEVNDGDLIISNYQPKSRLITSLFEPATKLNDTLTYDITAWSLPYAYGLETYALTDRIVPSKEYKLKMPAPNRAIDRPYAYIAKYNSVNDVKWLASVLKKDINVRVAHKPLKIAGQSFAKGSIVVTRRTNEKAGKDFDKIITASAKEFGATVVPVATGFSDNGTDLGSGDIARLKIPTIALLGGEQTSSLNFGEIWHYFEQQIDYPVTVIATDYFNRIDLEEYTVLIVPNGYYSLFDERTIEKVGNWVNSGGKLILIGNALRAFKDKPGFSLKEYISDENKKNQQEKIEPEDLLESYASSERDRLTSSIFGAVYKVTMDNTHPLAYGYDREYFSLKTNNSRYAFLENGYNVGVLKGKAQPISGFAGYKTVDKLENSLVFGVENKGGGQVIYMVDNPLFRAFWENGKLLFSNAVFIVD